MALHPALGIARRQLRRGPSVSAGDFVLTPVVLEERAAGATARGCWLVAAKRPVAVIVAGPGGRRLVRLDDLAQSNSGHPIASSSALGRANWKS
jgi:hypothetical protein